MKTQENEEREWLESESAKAEADAMAEAQQEDTKEYAPGMPKDIFYPEERLRTPGRYFFSVVEESVINPDYKGYRGGRIEVSDTESTTSKPIYEATVLLPEEFWEQFRKVFDWKESSCMPRIIWDYQEKP